MPVSITWNNFFNNYLRPALNDTNTTIIDSNRANLLTLFVLSDLQAKGLDDIQATLTSNVITSLEANALDAWNLIGFGVKYYYVNDPVVKYDSSAGTSITRDKDLIDKAQIDYFLHLRAYITIHKLATLTAAQFWTQKDVLESLNSGASKCCNDSLEDKLELIEAESNAKLAEIAREEEKDLAIGDQKRLNAIELKQLERRYELEDRKLLREKNAINGAWTPSGQFTFSYVLDHETEMTDTIPTVSRDLNNVDFGIPTLIQNQTYIGNSITNSNYRELSIEITASANITYTFKQLVGINYETVGSPVTDNVINKRYSLVNTTAYRIEITGTEPNTEVYIDAEVLA